MARQAAELPRSEYLEMSLAAKKGERARPETRRREWRGPSLREVLREERVRERDKGRLLVTVWIDNFRRRERLWMLHWRDFGGPGLEESRVGFGDGSERIGAGQGSFGGQI